MQAAASQSEASPGPEGQEDQELNEGVGSLAGQVLHQAAGGALEAAL